METQKNQGRPEVKEAKTLKQQTGEIKPGAAAVKRTDNTKTPRTKQPAERKG